MFLVLIVDKKVEPTNSFSTYCYKIKSVIYDMLLSKSALKKKKKSSLWNYEQKLGIYSLLRHGGPDVDSHARFEPKSIV